MTSDIYRRAGIFGVVLLVALLFLAPTFASGFFPERWLSKPISLGLDLRGGVHLVYEVNAKEAVASRLQGMANTIRTELKGGAGVQVPLLRAAVNSSSQIELTLLNDRQVERVKEVAKKQFPELQFIEVRPGEGTRVVVLFGITDAQSNRIEIEAVSQAVETLRNRVDQFGVAEPLIQKVGNKRILLQMPGVSDIASVKKVVGSVAKLEFRLVPQSGDTDNTVTLKDLSGVEVRVQDVALMTGDAVDTARVSIIDGKVEVSLTLTSEGGGTFQRITREHTGRQLAIILDDVVYSSPVIQGEIAGGRASITGGFTIDEARQLAVILRSGALPASLVVLEERTVGRTLGRESIERGILAIVVGFAAILLFMAVYYNKAGVVATGVLAVNILLVLGALSAFGATLTLPGLAGLALTVGMAVDANVIIYERIREELRIGAGRDAAVVAGFEKALSAIIDSNITTLLAGIILYYFGTGPIRGFAVTLSIGIVTTIFCAVFVSRLAFDAFELKGRKALLSI